MSICAPGPCRPSHCRRHLIPFCEPFGFRRLRHRCCHDGHDVYIDGLAPRVVLLVIFLVIGSAFDALFTLLHLQHGASEANPLMAMALAQGVNSFVSLKMTLTGLGAVLLAIHQNFHLGLKSLQALALVYAGLLTYHLVLFVKPS